MYENDFRILLSFFKKVLKLCTVKKKRTSNNLFLLFKTSSTKTVKVPHFLMRLLYFILYIRAFLHSFFLFSGSIILIRLPILAKIPLLLPQQMAFLFIAVLLLYQKLWKASRLHLSRYVLQMSTADLHVLLLTLSGVQYRQVNSRKPCEQCRHESFLCF